MYILIRHKYARIGHNTASGYPISYPIVSVILRSETCWKNTGISILMFKQLITNRINTTVVQ